MSTIRTYTWGIAVCLLALMAWVGWTPPAPPTDESSVQGSLIDTPGAPKQSSLWRIVTRRLVWGVAAKSMGNRLRQDGFTPILLQRKEPVLMHAFDDPKLYPTSKDASKAVDEWHHLGFDANVIKTQDGYMVGLGRFFITSYAEQMQQRLKRSGRKYRYQQRMVSIPTFRFTFPPMNHDKSIELWRKIQNLGIADPVLMPATRFQQMYGSALNRNTSTH